MGIGIPELIIVLVIILLVFGPKRLPMIGKQLGGGMREFKDSITRKGKNDEDEDEDGDEQSSQAALTAPADVSPLPVDDGEPAVDAEPAPRRGVDEQRR